MRLALVAGADLEFLLARLLVDGNEPAAALRQGAEDAEHLRLLLGDDLGHAAGIAVDVAGFERIDPQQRAVADAGHRHAGTRLARRDDDDGRDRAVFRLVPLGRHRDQLAVPVTLRDVRQDDGRQLAGLVDALAAPVDDALDLQVLEHLLQPDAVAALDVEALRDLPLAHLALGLGDEGDDVLAGGKGGDRAFGRLAKGEARSGSSGLVACKPGRG